MNRDRHVNGKRHEYRLRVPREHRPAHEPDDVAPWLIAQVREWPATVEDRLVAVRIGVGLAQVKRARREQP